MPKIKTNRGAAKRFRKTGTGKFKHRRTNRAHINTKMTAKRKRHLRGNGIVSPQETPEIRRMIPKA